MNATKSVLMAFLFLCSGNSFAQLIDKQPAAILELGAAADASLKGGGASFGPTVAVELTPIEHWLELEGGATRLFGRRSSEWDLEPSYEYNFGRGHEQSAGISGGLLIAIP